MTATPSGSSGSAALVAQVLFDLHTAPQLGHVLSGVVEAGARLGAPFALALLPFDDGVDAWHLTALLRPDGQPIALESLGVPLGPLQLDPAALAVSEAALPLEAVLGSAWGAEAAQALAARWGTGEVLLVSLGTDTRHSAKLLAFPQPGADPALLPLLLAHAAVALRRHLATTAEGGDSVLPADAFRRLLDHEVSRAERYNRPLSIVAIHLGAPSEIARVGPALGHRLRRWDAIGRASDERTVLLVLLPESTSAEAYGLVRRIMPLLDAARPGVAAMPEDGVGAERLLELAQVRAGRAAIRAGVDRPHDVWIREGSQSLAWGGRLPDQVRCPRCSALYLRPRRGSATPAEIEQHRQAAGAALAAVCPNHGDQFTV